jgi:hypothetical protein
MRTTRFAAAAAVLGLAGSVQAGLTYGTATRDQFAAWHAALGGVHLDFESVSAGTNLLPGTDPFGVGARFASIINTTGVPFGPEHVEVSASYGFSTYGKTIVGSPFPSGSDDGRVGYEVRFDVAQGRAGILRAWNTAAVTRFYNAAGVLLAEHVNTVSGEFVGWVAQSNDGSDFVARIVMDGNLISGTRQVGYSDDLYFGAFVPAPGGAALLLIALAAPARRRR